MIRHYQSSTGISGYHEGDVLVCDDTGSQSLVVRTGAGLQLEPYKGDEVDDSTESTTWPPSLDADLKVRALDFGEIENYYVDDKEIEAKRADWADAAEAWDGEIRAALESSSRADAIDHLRAAARIEAEWEDDPTTRLAAKILGVTMEELRS